MSYTKAKSSFEAVLQKMQADLQSYVVSGKANQRSVDNRIDIINKLIEYYQEAENLISEQEMENMAQYFNWSKLHTDLQKLADWCTLHHINPHPALLYEQNELQLLLIKGRRFGRPGDYDLPEESLEEIKAGSYNVTEILKDQDKYFHNYRACLHKY